MTMIYKNSYFQHNDGPSGILSPENQSPEPIKESKKWYCRVSNWFRIIIILGLISFITLAIIYHNVSADLFTKFLSWMKVNIVYGSIAFCLIYICCTVLMIPGSILTLGAGFVYVDILGTVIGVLASTTIVWISASIGATLSFINGRYLLRSCVESYADRYPKFSIIDRVVKEYGFSVTFWLRLSSITPYNVFNYFMGLTSVRIIDYILAHLGMVCCFYIFVMVCINYKMNINKIPDIAVYCFIGGSISEIVDIAQTGVGDNIAFIVVLTVTLAISIVGMITISYYAKKKFDKMVNEIKSMRIESDDFVFSDDDDGICSEMQIISHEEKQGYDTMV